MNESTPAGLGESDQALRIGLWLEPSQIPEELSFIGHLAMGLKSEGHTVCLLVPSATPMEQFSIFSDQIIPLSAPLRGWRNILSGSLQYYARPAAAPRDMNEVLAQCKARDLQVVILFGPSGLAFPDFAALPRTIPTLFWCWDMGDAQGALPRLPGISGVLGASEPMLKMLENNHPTRSMLLRPGVFLAEDQEPRYHRKNQSPCFVCLDSLSGLSDFSNLLRACRDLADTKQDFLMFLYDSGPDKHAIWKLTQSLDMLDRVSFVPYRHDCESLLLYGDFYLQVANSPRLNYLVLQAMARGLPVLGRINAAADFCIDAQSCQSVGGGGIADWRQAMLLALSADAEMCRVSASATQRLRQHHSMSDMLTRFIALCRQAIAAPIPFPQYAAKTVKH